jgi:hypothetical protein
MYYSLYRINRLPQTYLGSLPGNYTQPSSDTTFFMVPVWSLADTNALWPGLSISWTSDDSLDFPNGAPDFEYTWKLYRPFPTDYYDPDIDSININLDDVSDEDICIMSCADNDRGRYMPPSGEGSAGCDNPWVLDKSTTFVGLQTGCYLFSVIARDDALVPSPQPSWGKFIVYMPTWQSNPEEARDIMLLRATEYISFDAYRRGRPVITDQTGTPYYPDSLFNFYFDMIGTAGYDIDSSDVYGGIGELAPGDYPDIDVLRNYRMVIFDDMDYYQRELTEISNEHPFVQIMVDYMSAGGKVWVIGRQTFDPKPPELYSIGVDFATNSPAFLFFDLSSANYPMESPFPFLGDSAEFRSATSILDGFPSLSIDPARTLQMQHYGINKVEVLARHSAASRTLYTYNAANPDTMQDFQYMPCAVRNYPTNHVYKSSYFSFPLYMMDNSDGQVQAVFNEMLHWFLEE